MSGIYTNEIERAKAHIAASIERAFDEVDAERRRLERGFEGLREAFEALEAAASAESADFPEAFEAAKRTFAKAHADFVRGW